MGQIQKKAVQYHQSGHSCKDSVLRASAPLAGLSEREAADLAYPTDKRDTGKCGAVLAGLKIIEKKYGADAERIRSAFEDAFRNRNGALLCRELRGRNGHSCTDYVSDAAELLEQMLDKQKRSES